MNRREALIDALRDANPVPDEHRRYADSEEARALALLIEERRRPMSTPTRDRVPTSTGRTLSRRRWQPVVAVLFGLALLVAVGVPLILRGAGSDVATPSPSTTTSTTTLTTTPLAWAEVLSIDDLPARLRWARRAVNDRTVPGVWVCPNLQAWPALSSLEAPLATQIESTSGTRGVYEYLFRDPDDAAGRFARLASGFGDCLDEFNQDQIAMEGTADVGRLALPPVGDERFAATIRYVGRGDYVDCNGEPCPILDNPDRLVDQYAIVRVGDRIAILWAYEWASADEPAFLTDSEFADIVSRAASRLSGS